MEQETFCIFSDPPKRQGYSNTLFLRLFEAWQDWKRGIPPGREWTARGAQNPRLLMAFRACEAGEARAERARLKTNGS